MCEHAPEIAKLAEVQKERSVAGPLGWVALIYFSDHPSGPCITWRPKPRPAAPSASAPRATTSQVTRPRLVSAAL